MNVREVNICLKVFGQDITEEFEVPSDFEIAGLKELIQDFVTAFPKEDVRLLFNHKAIPENGTISDITPLSNITIHAVPRNQMPHQPPSQIFENDDMTHLRLAINEIQRIIARINKSAAYLLSLIEANQVTQADKELIDLIRRIRSDYAILINQKNIIASHKITNENDRLMVRLIDQVQPQTNFQFIEQFFDKDDYFISSENLPQLISGVNLTRQELATVLNDELLFSNSQSNSLTFSVKNDHICDKIIES